MLVRFVVTAKLSCTFVFAYAKCWFSHNVAHFISRLTGSCEEVCFSVFDDKKFGFSASFDIIQIILFSGKIRSESNTIFVPYGRGFMLFKVGTQ